MHDLIEYIANWIVDDADAVSVHESERGNRAIIRLEVDESDMGRVIGREGRLAQPEDHGPALGQAAGDLEDDQDDQRVLEEVVVERTRELRPEHRSEPTVGDQRA